MDTPLVRRAFLLVVSGPAGIGKTTVCERLLKTHGTEIERAVTTTSRDPRGREVDGEHYHFRRPAAFAAEVAAGDFYEHARVHTSDYGTYRSEIDPRIERGVSVLLNIDVQGAAAWRKLAETEARLRGRLVTVFLYPERIDVIEARLRERGEDDEAEIARRLETARREMERWPEYDYCLTSGTRDADFQRLEAIFRAEQLRVG